MTKHKIWEMIAPNGKPLGECTKEELGQIAEWLKWLAREGAHLHGIKYPPEDDCTTVELMMFAAWREWQEELLKARRATSVQSNSSPPNAQTRPETGLPPAPRLPAVRRIAVGTSITGRRPHRSVRAGFPHTAPTVGV